ncbi:phospholipase D family protein [Paracoccus methylarcula]|uniref:Phospholipase D n=1 Tax=Paracoccus methylarcula TaxID=72022 RepID=A0A422R1L7_9RHOB|nr:phospholipase D family protein [Paracoccus methylarcula]RNF36090.1 phospholipase D family protein [Paracoccus methylarcula]
MLKRLFKYVLILVVVALAFVVVGRQIWPLPDISERPADLAAHMDPETGLGKLAADGMAAHPGTSGVLALAGGADALASRLALIERAEDSIDAQYYIWHDDSSGILLLDALRRAGARGVRVRLLLDDNGVPGLDQIMATLNAQPNIQIRLFNPSTIRQPKLLGYALDFFRMNRRMHNKAMIVDNAVAIIGGRNIGDEYFQVGREFYVDLDVLAVGPIVSETSDAFDRYWNSASVFELERIIDLAADLDAFHAHVTAQEGGERLKEIITETQTSAESFVKGQIRPEWTDVDLVVDDPAKGQGQARRDQLMIVRLGRILGDVRQGVDLVSAYFVPGQAGTAYFEGLAQSGKRVRILTNALNTTDVLLVHGGYAKYRRELLQAGVELFELKLRGAQSNEEGLQVKPLGLSGASLHAKTFSVDHERVFIGSFNFDPRSALLNCEMGFLIRSPSMARKISDAFDNGLAQVSYRPALTPEGKMIWREDVGPDDSRVYQEEPGATWMQQVMLTVIGLLPVEWLL